MPVSRSCPYYAERECAICGHGSFTECKRYRRCLSMRHVACLGRFVYEPTGFGVECHRRVMVVWCSDSLLLKRWIMEDSVLGRFNVVRMDMSEVKTLVMYEEGSYDDRIDSLGVSVNNGGGIYLDLSGITHSDVYDRGNTIFAVLRNFVFLCVSRRVRVYIDCCGGSLEGMNVATRDMVVGQNVFLCEYMTGGVGYRLFEGDGHNLLVSTPESRYLRGGIGAKTVLLGLVPWQKWLLGKKGSLYVVSGGGKLSDREEGLMRSGCLVGADGGESDVESGVGYKSRLRVFTEDVDYKVGGVDKSCGDVESVKSESAGSGSVSVSSEQEFVERVREMKRLKYEDGGNVVKKSIKTYL